METLQRNKGKDIKLFSLNNLKAGIVLSLLSQPFEVIRTSSIIKNINIK